MDTRVGPYRILRLIRRGGQGSVYLGFDDRLRRRVAIKIYRLPRQRAGRRQLLREAQTVARLNSPKIVQVFDVIESRGHLAMVMEYVPGCGLDELLAATRPSLASVLIAATDVAGALAVARQNGVVHGDVKAANVLITTTGRARLTDFGIARMARADGEHAGTPGSLAALSPEQYLGLPLDSRSDLFSLGCLVYHMLCGRHPFCDGQHLDAQRLLQGRHRPLADLVAVPPALVAAVDDLLQKTPEARPRTTRQLRQVMRECLGELPMAARGNLLQEARPCFRPEHREDIPPRIPAGLGREGRSMLPPGEGCMERLRYGWHRLRWPGRLALSVALLVFAVAPLVLALQLHRPVIGFHAPRIEVPEGVVLPRDVSAAWLLREVKVALSGRLGELRVVGGVGAPPPAVLYSPNAPVPAEPAPQQVFAIDLRCSDAFCVFAVQRQAGEQRVHRHGMLFPDMSLRQWRQVVREATRALYP